MGPSSDHICIIALSVDDDRLYRTRIAAMSAVPKVFSAERSYYYEETCFLVVNWTWLIKPEDRNYIYCEEFSELFAILRLFKWLRSTLKEAEIAKCNTFKLLISCSSEERKKDTEKFLQKLISFDAQSSPMSNMSGQNLLKNFQIEIVYEIPTTATSNDPSEEAQDMIRRAKVELTPAK